MQTELNTTIVDAEFNRFDICAAHAAIEVDWGVGGIVRERASNRRRHMSTGYQLNRMKYRAGPLMDGGWDGLENDNQRAIYVNLTRRYGFTVDARYPEHQPIIEWVMSL